jgi:hypothetical protein
MLRPPASPPRPKVSPTSPKFRAMRTPRVGIVRTPDLEARFLSGSPSIHHLFQLISYFVHLA